MINKLISCLVAFLFAISSMAQQKVSYQRDYLYMVDKINGVYIPKDINEAISALDTLLNIDKHFIKDSVSLTDFCRDLSLNLILTYIFENLDEENMTDSYNRKGGKYGN